jgi:hypothetical protein
MALRWTMAEKSTFAITHPCGGAWRMTTNAIGVCAIAIPVKQISQLTNTQRIPLSHLAPVSTG